MRIRQLDLIKYGKFQDESLVFPQAAHDFHVVIGPNEAGKSTVRNAVLELLFGMPLRTPLAFLHELTELRLGAVLENAAGEARFHRARGRSQLRTAADEKLPDDYLAPFLGGASRESFEQMFGLDHERLVQGGRSILDASKDLGRVLFQSAAGISSLGAVREALEARAAQLWTRRGSSSEYAQAEARLGEAGAEFKAAHVRTKVWAEAREAVEQVDAEIDAARQDRLRLETERSRLERVRRLTPLLQELGVTEGELVALGEVVDLPPTAHADLVKAQADLLAAGKVLQERRKDLEARQRERQGLTVDDEVLALAPDIEALDAMRGACVHYPRDLPLRRAEAERLLQEAFAAAAQLGWPTDADALRRSLPSALALKTVVNLLREHGALHQARVGAEDAAAEKERDLQALHQQLEGLTASEVPDELRRALANAQALGNSRSRQQALGSELAEARRQLDHALAAVARWSSSPDALRAMELPSAARVTALQREEQELLAALRNARRQLEEAQARVEALRLEEKHFTEGHKVVTPAEVRAARIARDGAWNEIRTGSVSIASGAPGLDASMRLADELVDTQLVTATEAASLQSIRQQAELARSEVQRRQQALLEREAELARFRFDWDQLAAAAGVPGMAIDGLPDWLNRRDSVFTAEAAVRQRAAAVAGEEAQSAQAAGALAAALAAASLPACDPADLQALAAAGAGFVRQADAARTQKEALEQQVTRAARALETLKAKAGSAAAAFRHWEEQWQQALQAARLAAAATTFAQAAGAVELANTVAEKLQAAEDIVRNRIRPMEADLAALEAETRRLAGLVDSGRLEDGDWSAAGQRLLARLRAATTAAQAATLADLALREARSREEEAGIALAQAQARIQPLLELAGVASIEAALPLAQRSGRRRELALAIEKAMGTLFREGDGLGRAAIAAEIAQQDPVAVVGQLEQAKRDLAVVGERLNALAQRQLTAQQAFGAINGQANAASAEARRQEALAAIGEATEEYLEMATASRLLKWAIDRYRDQKQGPMLQRAGEVFAQVTLGRFTRLVVDHEVTPPALFARRGSGKLVEVAGLSEGTRDQLFLALRIAALELHLGHAPALPFVADDLFVNFDDQRAKAGLEALRELSRHTQVLFLTHHEHLLPIVQEVFGAEVNVARLQRLAEVA